MARDELPPPIAPNENIREATLAGQGLTLYDSFGGDATGYHGSLVIEPDIHVVHVIGCQLHIGIRRLLQAFEVLFLRRDSATGVGKDELFGFDAIKERIVVIDVRFANVPL